MEIRIIWNWFTSFKVSNDIGREKIPGSEDATCVVISREVSEKEFPLSLVSGSVAAQAMGFLRLPTFWIGTIFQECMASVDSIHGYKISLYT